MRVVAVAHQQQVLAAIYRLMVVLAVRVAVVAAIKLAVTLVFHLRPAQQTPAVAVVTAAQVDQVL
jgi:hypothetical protein